MNLATEPTGTIISWNECDTDADTCCLGKNFKIYQRTNRSAEVYSYDPKAPPKIIPIVTGATSYDDPITEETIVLLFHECLYYGTQLEHSLINPNQIRYNGIDTWDNPFDKSRNFGIEIDNSTFIPFSTKGTKIYFKSRTPTYDELRDCRRIDMTSMNEWNPSEVQLKSISRTSEEKIRNCYFIQAINADYTNPYERTWQYDNPTSDEAILHSINPILTQWVKSTTRSTEALPLSEIKILQEPRTYISTQRHNQITAEDLAEKFCIGLERAQATLRATRQRGTRSAILPISRRYRADRRFELKRLNGKFATDTLWSKVLSLEGNKASQIYSHKCGFKVVYHMKRANGENVGNTLSEFVHNYGAPEHLTFDGAAVQKGTNTLFYENLRRSQIKWHMSGPRRAEQNPAEAAIRELKGRWYRLQSKLNIPDRLWDFGMAYIAETGNVIATSSRYAKGRTPLEMITGETPDISEYLDFGFYDWVTFRQNAGLGPLELGRWLGVSHRIGQLMSYWILPKSSIPISCTTVQRLTSLEMQRPAFIERMNDFNDGIKRRMDTKNKDISNEVVEIEKEKVIDVDEEFEKEFTRVIDNEEVLEADDQIINDGVKKERIDEEYGIPDSYLGMEVNLMRPGEDVPRRGTVKKRIIDNDGKPIGIPNNNPMLDTRKYEVEFLDGTVDAYTANTLADNILNQVDDEGTRQMMLDEIIDHRKNEDAIPKSEGTYVTQSGTLRKKRTTKGWELLVHWLDGSYNWIKLKDLKESYPVELMKYAEMKNISDEPAFAWWTPYTRRKMDRIINKVKSKYWERTHKYGIRLPKSIHEALEIDKENKNTLWKDAIDLEMRDVRIGFEVYDGDVNKLIGYEEIKGHIVFDIKLGENFRRKARYVGEGFRASTPASVTYSSVVRRDSVRIMLMIAALNDIDIMGADIKNAFLTAPCKEKVWLRAGPEFGVDQGKILIVVRALYGLKSASASFRSFMAAYLDELGFLSSDADNDVWLRPATKKNGEEYYEYVLMYVDDILAISENAKQLLEDIQKKDRVKFKNGKIAEPEMYLGGRLCKKNLNGINCWTISSIEYLSSVIKNVEEYIKDSKYQFPKKIRTPMSNDYQPEFDETNELDPQWHTYYQELIGMLRWGCELGRVDILHEISILSQYQGAPREGHLEQLLRVVAYLKSKPKLTLYMNPEFPRINCDDFAVDRSNFEEYYRHAEEEIPKNAPKPRGRFVSTTAFVDASFGQNKKNRKSHTGFVIFVNRAPVLWYSKQQKTVETSAFSAEHIALKVCVEAIEGLRFKLRMFGIPLRAEDSKEDEPTKVYCDNKSVVRNASRIESTLDKKHSSIAYHFTRYCVAAGIIVIGWIDGKNNIADAFTKRLPELVRDFLFGNWTY